jgi:hypothetical protein
MGYGVEQTPALFDLRAEHDRGLRLKWKRCKVRRGLSGPCGTTDHPLDRRAVGTFREPQPERVGCVLPQRYLVISVAVLSGHPCPDPPGR